MRFIGRAVSRWARTSTVVRSTGCPGFVRKWGYSTKLYRSRKFLMKFYRLLTTARLVRVKGARHRTDSYLTLRVPLSRAYGSKKVWPAISWHEEMADTRPVVPHSHSSREFGCRETSLRI